MGRVLFIGDIHGCNQTFRNLVEEQIQLKQEDQLYCIGDYIDRGPDSKGVVDYILELRGQGYRIHTLRGNHEQMLIDSLYKEESRMLWRFNGGDTTLESFGVKSAGELASNYLDFFMETQFYISTDDFFAVHAGLNFSISNPLKDKEAMLWIRGFMPDKGFLKGRKLIYGHTPQTKTDILLQKGMDTINIDGGCVYASRKGMGNLVAFELHTNRFLFEAFCG